MLLLVYSIGMQMHNYMIAFIRNTNFVCIYRGTTI